MVSFMDSKLDTISIETAKLVLKIVKRRGIQKLSPEKPFRSYNPELQLYWENNLFYLYTFLVYTL